VRRNRRKRGELGGGWPSTAMVSHAPLENIMYTEPEEHMQQDTVENSNAGMVTLQGYNTSESRINTCIHIVLLC
jgi:hypothetical protein